MFLHLKSFDLSPSTIETNRFYKSADQLSSARCEEAEYSNKYRLVYSINTQNIQNGLTKTIEETENGRATTTKKWLNTVAGNMIRDAMWNKLYTKKKEDESLQGKGEKRKKNETKNMKSQQTNRKVIKNQFTDSMGWKQPSFCPRNNKTIQFRKFNTRRSRFLAQFFLLFVSSKFSSCRWNILLLCSTTVDFRFR